jgi:phosphatidylserine decarboxylase
MRHVFRFIPIAGDGWKFILGFGIPGLALFAIGFLFAKMAGILLVILAIFSILFFRDPERKIPVSPCVLSPADGTVMEITEVDGEGYGRGTVIRIFLSIFNVHIQRAPIQGTIRSVTYQPGGFLDARDLRAHFSNEANLIEIENPCGRIVIKQIAGKIARRIVCWVRPGDRVIQGARMGLIRFGSQVNVYVPPAIDILVKKGDRVYAGVTVISAPVQALHSKAAP